MNINEIREKYDSFKSEYVSLLFFRVGEFYITLFDDATFIGNLMEVETSVIDENGDNMEYILLSEDRMYDMIQEIQGKAIIPFTIFETEELDIKL